MTPEDLIARGGAVLALDTNAITGFGRLQRLCNLVAQLREPPHPIEIRLYVPAVVHAEVLFDLQQSYGQTYDADIVLRGLKDKGLEVQPFEERHAEHAAARLGRSFPSREDWRAAKKKRCLQCLGLREQDVQVAGSGASCGATIDFVIAAHATHEGWILVTDDKGPDFAGIERKMKLEQVERCLADLLASRAAPS